MEATCKGSITLGTACMTCTKCKTQLKDIVNNISTDELLVELSKRKKETSRPQVIVNPLGLIEFKKLINTSEAVLDDIEEKGYSKDQSTYIYEAAMTCIYGEKVWVWMNKYDEGC